MSAFDEEWAEIKRETAVAEADRTRLAGTGDGGRMHVVDDLKVDPSVLRERATKTDEVRGNFAKADDSVMTATGEVAGGIAGFRSAAAFSTFVTRWKEQMRYLDDVFQQGVAQPLREAANKFQAREENQTSQFSTAEREEGVR